MKKIGRLFNHKRQRLYLFRRDPSVDGSERDECHQLGLSTRFFCP